MEIQASKKKQLFLGICFIVSFLGVFLWQATTKTPSGRAMFLCFLHIFLFSLMNETALVFQLLKENRMKIAKNTGYFLFAIINIIFLYFNFIYVMITYMIASDH